MKTRIRLESLTLIGARKSYSVQFKDGFNLISGPTSTGKTSILEMIDYALGAKSHKSYIEIGNSCSQVELVLYIGKEKYLIRRQLFNFTAPVIVEDWNEEKKRFLFYNRFEIDTPKNPKSLSAFLIEKVGFANISITGQTFSFRDLFKYCYIKQTEIDNEDILEEKSWEKNIKRKATFEIIYNIYNKALEELRSSLEDKKNEAKELSIRLEGIQDFLKNIEIESVAECNKVEKRLKEELLDLQNKLTAVKADQETNSAEFVNLRKEIQSLKSRLELVQEEKTAQSQYVNKLRLLYNQYASEIEKDELAIEGYIAFSKFEFQFCPNCLQPIKKINDAERCCLCGGKRGSDSSEMILLKKDISILQRKSNELLKFTEIEDQKCDELIRKENGIKTQLYELEVELQQLSKDYINPHIEQIEYLNYEIGKKNRLLLELQKNLKMFEEVDRYHQLITDKEKVIQQLKNNIKNLVENSVSKDELMQELSSEFEKILGAFQYPKLSSAYINEKNYLPYVRGRKYDDIGSLAGVTLITMAYYVALLLVGVRENFNHPGILIIDSPRKNLGAQASKSEDDEFKDESIFNATMKHLYEIAEQNKECVQVIVVNNGYPEFIPHECIVVEFDPDQKNGLPLGLIDDAV